MPSFLQSLSAFFSGSGRETSSASNSHPTRKRQTMLSTTDAFALPTHSPIIHEDSPRSSNSPAFHYPPQATNASYDFVPENDITNGRLGARSSSTSPISNSHTQSPILPMHNNHLGLHATALGGQLASYPPLNHTWNRLRAWLNTEYNELGDTLNYGIQAAAIANIQLELGLPLPSSVRESYLCCDGQEVESSAGCSEGLFFGMSFLPLENVVEEWRFWRDVDEDPNTGANPRLKALMKSIPEGYVRKEYSCRGWLPLVTDRTGNYLGVDCNPGEEGTYGQVIVFGRDFDTKVVMWKGEGEGGWGRWLASFAEELENGEGYELGNGSDNSDGSEDEIGHESYFFGGTGKGDGAGEGNSGGLRLTGQYKGWSVLEAWADRSVKKWVEAGLYTEEAEPPLSSADNPIIVVNQGPGTEVSIPSVVGSESKISSIPPPIRIPDYGDTESVTSEDNTTATPTTPTTRNQLPPIISVTMPPAPQPVLLPTPTSITLSQSDSEDHLSDEDIQDQDMSSKPMHLSRMASDDSASLPLVEDTSFVISSDADLSTDSNLVEVNLLPQGSLMSPDGLKDPRLPSPIHPTMAPPPRRSEDDDEFELKTPTAATFSPPSLMAAVSSKNATPVETAPVNGVVRTNGDIRTSADSPLQTIRLISKPSTDIPTPAESPAASPVPFPASEIDRPDTPNSISSKISPSPKIHKRPMSSSFALIGGRKGILPDGDGDQTSSDKEDKDKTKKRDKKKTSSVSSFNLKKGLGLSSKPKKEKETS